MIKMVNFMLYRLYLKKKKNYLAYLPVDRAVWGVQVWRVVR